MERGTLVTDFVKDLLLIDKNEIGKNKVQDTKKPML